MSKYSFQHIPFCFLDPPEFTFYVCFSLRSREKSRGNRQKRIFAPKNTSIFITMKTRKPLQIKASGESGVKWARTIDLHDVNVTL